MKNLKLSLVTLSIFLHFTSQAQLSAGTAGFYILPNTNVIIDSLVIVPTTNASIVSTNVVRTATAIVSPTGKSITRVHTFSQPVSVTGLVGLFYLPTELNGNLAPNLAFVYQKSSNLAYITSTNSILNLGSQYITQIMTGDPMLKVSATTAGITLPILLSAYTARAEGSKARIDWTTTSEQNADRYEVERSSDGINYTSIATVQSVNDNSSHTYYAYDNSPIDGENYYRLTQYDLDGTKKLFGVKVIDFKGLGLLTVLAYPNPVVNKLSVKLQNYAGTKVDVSLYDFHGKLLHQETILTSSGQTIYPVNLKSKPLSGDYILKVSGVNGLNESIKVTVL